MNYSFEPIGILRTCFKEKFGIPRQPGLVKEAKGVLKLQNHPFFRNAVRELEGFSHIWVIFVFHRHDAKNWKPSIRPPRLGGAKKVGVLASRSPHRPNPIGLSAVRLERIDLNAPGGIEIHLSGVDFLDETPVLDIKPYIPYADSIPLAQSGWADTPIQRTPVRFMQEALEQIEFETRNHPGLKEMIIEMLELDPRPAFQKRQNPADNPKFYGSRYGFRLFEFDVKWEIQEGCFAVRALEQFHPKGENLK